MRKILLTKDLKKIGDYCPYVQIKGAMEMSGKDIPNGTVFWTVKMEEGVGYDTLSQDTAIILSELLQIKQMLKKLKR